ncbi:MAG: hypothetical protein H0A75_06455 [Candidatus Methanofishera endochildressiae]|uniref:Uncharacterized protein n=1 Tax=Candidatus Methanofishera endochildressiae TaxID=2738884 RepID=A0A7Z0MPC3_9GAMM|nr:hypothetical protein [Candidatus Methanofishera endochildressiae]
MSAHRDEFAINIVSDKGLDYFQVLLVMSRKGEDYHSGGGFVICDGKFIDIDQNPPGDIIIYDGNLFTVSTPLIQTKFWIWIMQPEGLQHLLPSIKITQAKANASTASC